MVKLLELQFQHQPVNHQINNQGWFCLELTGLISLESKELTYSWILCCAVLSWSVMSDSLWSHGLSYQAPLPMGILQARILGWVAMPSSRGSSQPRDQTQVSCIAGGSFTVWTTRVAQVKYRWGQTLNYRKKLYLEECDGNWVIFFINNCIHMLL